MQPEDAVTALAFVRRVVQYLARPQDVDDLVQDTMLAVYSRGNYRGDAKYTTWLYQVAVNTVRDHLRRAGRQRRAADLDELPVDLASDFDLHARTVALIDAAKARRAVARLGERCEIVFEKRYVQGMTEGEVAEDMGISIAAVKARAHRARTAAAAAIVGAAA
jgi:RNA polymerase sigma-70 factor (ECF subfamily)